jgi:cytochrome b6-f complex iron-sulfur subunit
MPDENVDKTPEDQEDQPAEEKPAADADKAAAGDRPAARERPQKGGAEEKKPARVAGPNGAADAEAGGRQVVIARPPEAAAGRKVSRRGLMLIGFWSGLGGLLVACAASTLNLLYPRGITGFGGVVFVGTVDQLQPGQRLRSIEARAWIVRFNADQARRNNAEEGAILALWQRCPHLGCVVPYLPAFSWLDPRNDERYPGWFRCPCHASTYSDAGVRVFGPATRSMDTFDLTIDNGNLLVDTGAITPGDDNNGQRAILPG